MPRILAAILLVAVLAIGGGLIATTAYQAGLSTTVTITTASGAAVAMVVVPASQRDRATSSPGRSCSTPSTALPSRRMSGRSIRTSRTCVGSSSPTRAGRATC